MFEQRYNTTKTKHQSSLEFKNNSHALTFTSTKGGGRQFGFSNAARIFIILPLEHWYDLNEYFI